MATLPIEIESSFWKCRLLTVSSASVKSGVYQPKSTSDTESQAQCKRSPRPGVYDRQLTDRQFKDYFYLTGTIRSHVDHKPIKR